MGNGAGNCKVKWARGLVTAAVGLLIPATALAVWPPPLGADMSKPENWPNDPGFAQHDGSGNVTGGDWNQWSFVPVEWTKNVGFRQDEVKMGTGMHADRAWQRTVGDRRVIVAVLDSGIKWDADDLVNKHFLNRKELPIPAKECQGPKYDAAKDAWDADGDGIFNMQDYAKEDGNGLPKTPCHPGVEDLNKNGFLDPQDLIKVFSDGKDDDGNGYVDDISGWDFFRNDNDAYDDTRYGHGTGEANDSTAEGNNGRGGLGICPECTTLMVRVGDSFVADGNDFAAGVIFAVDSGASVVQEALGTLNRSDYAESAIDYAYANNVVIIASAADELSFHHNMPGTTDHTVYVHAIVFDQGSAKNSTTFLNFNNCTNFGGNLLLSSPGTGCSSEATGVTSGHAGMIYAAGLQAKLELPLSAEELRGILIMSTDDINVPESKTDPTKFPSGEGWDLHFGYGRNNVRTSVDLVLDDKIPPELDVLKPSWFEPIEVTRTPKVKVTGRVGKRADGKGPRYKEYTWTLEVAKGIDPKSGWSEVKKGTTAGIDGEIAELDVLELSKQIDFAAPLIDHDQYSFTLRLRAEAKTASGNLVKNEFRKSFGLYKDPDLLPGFPKHIKTSVEASGKMVDLNGDGKDEWIQPTTDGDIHAWQADGKELAGWPAKAPIRHELKNAGVHNVSKACAYRTDKAGCIAKNLSFKPEFRELVLGTPAIGDLDGDGKLEVVVTTYDGNVVAYGADGQVRPGFPVEVDRQRSRKARPDFLWDDGIFAAPVLADLDKDGKLEIIVPAMDQMLYVWRHDGKAQPGFPVLISDPNLTDSKGEQTMGDRIITTAAVGDVDNDGNLDIATGSNEVLGADKAKNEGRGYVVHGNGNLHKGADGKPQPFLDGFPVSTYGLMAYVLPTVGSGVPGNPVLVDLDLDGKLEVNFDTIGSSGTFFTWEGKTFCIGKKAGKCQNTFTNGSKNFGPKTNTKEKTAAYLLIASGTVGNIDGKKGVDFVKAAAGFDFALTFASGGQRAEFDHLLAAWDSESGAMLEGWPRVMNDWQFFANPSIVDIDADGKPEVVAASAGYLVHAWNYLGDEPKAWPKYTMGWVLASPTIGDLDGDGNFDVAVGTRDGHVFAWKAPGKVAGAIVEWQSHGHDLHNTANYHSKINPYAKTAVPKPDTDAGSTADTAAGPDVVTAPDVTADASKPATPPPAAKDDGCTAGRNGSDGLGILAVLFALALLVAVRRNRTV